MVKSTVRSITTLAVDQTDIAITIYNGDLGLVKDTRKLDLPEGAFDLVFMDVASRIEPSSVHFVSRTNPESLAILEQNYEYDLVSTDALFKRHIDMKVKVVTMRDREIEGVLLAYDKGELVIKTASGIVIVRNAAEVTFGELPEGLITRPTLRWSLVGRMSGKHECEMSYLTGGLDWEANYVAVAGEKDDVLDLTGWVTIDNTSGASYHNANLKLVAGEVNRAEPELQFGMKEMTVRSPMAMAAAPVFEEESFFEYHLYSLQRPATVLHNQKKQISLLEAAGVRVKKLLVFQPKRSFWNTSDTQKENLKAYLEFKNSEESGLGMPLPKGIIRVYKKDLSGALQFIGEDSIDHTPKDEEMKIFLGESFDIIGEWKLADRRMVVKKKDAQIWEFDVEVMIRNHKDEGINVKYQDKVWGDWEILSKSHEYVEKDASTIEFSLTVEANSSAELKYTVRR